VSVRASLGFAHQLRSDAGTQQVSAIRATTTALCTLGGLVIRKGRNGRLQMAAA
jgi:hypothetical protein